MTKCRECKEPLVKGLCPNGHYTPYIGYGYSLITRGGQMRKRYTKWGWVYHVVIYHSFKKEILHDPTFGHSYCVHGWYP